jgi:signal transduction histidine kinase
MAAPANVLLVDDEPANLLALSAVLEPLGQRTMEARSGAAALRLLLEHDFAVILLDVRMPGMDGLETAAAIKQREKSRHTPIIFLTGEPSLRLKSYECGAVDYVVKPYEPDIVRSKVSVFVELYKRGQRIVEQEARLRQKEVEDQQRRWLETILDRTPTPLILVHAPTGALYFANRAARELQGGNGTNGNSHLKVPFDGEPHEVEWGGRTFVATGAEIPAGLGHESMRVLSLVDVTRLKQVEVELQNAIHVRDDFMSIASHELHTPLTPLKLQVERLRRGSRGNDDLGTKLTIVERQVDRLTNLVNQLLDVSRITGGKLRLQTEEVDLGAVVTGLTEALEVEVQRSGSTLDVNIEKDVVGRWDPTRIEQIAQNLLANAIKYGEGKPIEVGVSAENGWARLSVRDHGIGVAADQQARIFERFERAVPSRHYGGFGLGLWIVRQIVEASGGKVRVESEVGAGSTFTVELPR